MTTSHKKLVQLMAVRQALRLDIAEALQRAAYRDQSGLIDATLCSLSDVRPTPYPEIKLLQVMAIVDNRCGVLRSAERNDQQYSKTYGDEK